ncbi:MAG: CBS domain-containing protein [Cyclobacteriaceae bacterium]|nr:CBS domain-containing protein [Cyclobacteriaceae bacterium]MDH4295247.1 CBS domain-containing protein [Cyclobacteriaceae bacterium]MDH5251547.1 CBS domain-containing protein [Cyclobacteriaceae bacterium]
MNFKPNLMSKEEINASLPKYESIVKYMVKRKDLITFSPNDDINKIIDIIIDKKISGAPVLDEGGKLVGIISEKDCLRIIVDQAYHNLPYNSPKVSDYMTKNVKTLSPDSDVVEAATLFLDSPVRRMPVVDNGTLIGQISRRDILRAAKNINPAQWH